MTWKEFKTKVEAMGVTDEHSLETSLNPFIYDNYKYGGPAMLAMCNVVAIELHAVVDLAKITKESEGITLVERSGEVHV